MAYTAFETISPHSILNQVGDPSVSALRVKAHPENGIQYSAGFSISGMSATGSGAIMDSRAWGRGVALLRISGNSASAEILVSHDTASNIWVAAISAYTGQYTANCDNLIAVEQPYPYLRGQVSFVSASGGVTAAVWLYFHRVAG